MNMITALLNRLEEWLTQNADKALSLSLLLRDGDRYTGDYVSHSSEWVILETPKGAPAVFAMQHIMSASARI